MSSDPSSAMSVYDFNWNIAVNLGVKCPVIDISKKAKVRYISSPFDNIDTVDGLRDVADALATGFKGYMDDVSQWNIENYSKNGEILQKRLTHKKFPGILFPHFNAAWTNGEMTQEDVEAWIKGEDTAIDRVWKHYQRTFSKRQQRLVALLKSKNKILFIRTDVTSKFARTFKSNQDADIQYFMEKVGSAYPNSDFGFLYLYHNGKNERKLTSHGPFCTVELIPECATEEELEAYAISRLKTLKLLPKDKMEPYAFNEGE